MEPIRVCIGVHPKFPLPEKVLKFSIRQRTNHPVEFISMSGPEWEVPPGLPQEAGLSLRRFLIARFFGGKGRAIYLNPNQLVLHDIHDLWTVPETVPSDSAVWLTYQSDKHYQVPAPQTSVMVIECARASDWDPDNFWDWLRCQLIDLPDFMHLAWLNPPPQRIETGWNELNGYHPDTTRLLHFSREAAQPWYKPSHPLACLWAAELGRALKAGYVTGNEVEHALAQYSKPTRQRRKTNGLHPHYARYLRAPIPEPAPPSPELLQALAKRKESADARSGSEAHFYELGKARLQVRSLKRKLDKVRQSWSYQLGAALADPVGLVKRLVRRKAG